VLGLGEVFTLLFVTLGPMKLLGPFSQQTQSLDAADLRKITLRSFAMGLVAVIAGGYLGKIFATTWHISVPAIEIATGIILFLVAIDLVLSPYSAAHATAPAPLPSDPTLATLRVTFPLLVTPYGIAAIIALLFIFGDARSNVWIFVMLIAVMLLNLIGMLYIRQIMRGPVRLVLQILGSILGVLQVALAVQIVIAGLRALHLIAPA
jgi:small neutral amino acid transporter SnatA (MarC family)